MNDIFLILTRNPLIRLPGIFYLVIILFIISIVSLIP